VVGYCPLPSDDGEGLASEGSEAGEDPASEAEGAEGSEAEGELAVSLAGAGSDEPE
jgi:hypothetical protein